MIDGRVRHRPELESVELARAPHHGLTQFLQLQVFLHFAGIKIVFRLAHLLGIESIIPRLDGDSSALLFGDGLHIRHFLVHAATAARHIFIISAIAASGVFATCFSIARCANVG